MYHASASIIYVRAAIPSPLHSAMIMLMAPDHAFVIRSGVYASVDHELFWGNTLTIAQAQGDSRPHS